MPAKPKIVNCSNHPPERQHMTVAEVALRFQVEGQTVYRWIAKGLITPLRIGRAIRFKREDVERIGQTPKREQKHNDDAIFG